MSGPVWSGYQVVSGSIKECQQKVSGSLEADVSTRSEVIVNKIRNRRQKNLNEKINKKKVLSE